MKICIPVLNKYGIVECSRCGRVFSSIVLKYTTMPVASCLKTNDFEKKQIISFPSLSTRISNYIKSRKIWVTANKPIRPIETIQHIFNTYCKECDHYKTTGYACDICGCYINENNDWNKIAWSTTRCPDQPPKWIEEKEYSSEVVDGELESADDIPNEAISPEPVIPPPPPPVKKKGGCGCGG